MAPRISATLLRTQPDRRLVALAADGSEPAFEALVERYRRPLQAYCRRMLLPSDVAEDVVQQALLSTWQTLRRGTEIQDPRAWLYRVTHNTALNALRRSGYRYEELDEALQGAGAPDEDLERRTAVRQALTGLAGLPELQRQALLRTAVEGQSHEDVARALGISDGAVRGLVYRARATLRTAAAALTPTPIVVWAAGAGSRSGPMAERIGELVAGGGASLGVAAVLAKGGATVAAVGALAGGAVVVSGEQEVDSAKARPAASAPAAADAAPPAAVSAAARAAQTVDPEARLHSAKAGAAAELRRVTERRRRGRGRGRGRGGDDDTQIVARTREEDDDVAADAQPVEDRSGPSSSSGSGSSGSGSDSSGSSSDDDRTDSSGSGTSGSGSSGSGSDDPPDTLDDSSGSGSGSDDSSGSGSGSDDSSGSGSSGTTTVPTAPSIDDSSGKGGGGDDVAKVDSSGSGSGKLPEPDEPEED